MARYVQVPREDFSVQGQRVAWSSRYRGQDIRLFGTVQYRRWDRNYGMYLWRVTPDRLEEYGNTTHFDVSVLQKDLEEVVEEVVAACERCGKAGAQRRCITVLLDYGLGNGTAREEVHYDLCDTCLAIADAAQPVDADQFFSYEVPDPLNIPETHDYAYADHERAIVNHGEWY